MKVKQTTLVERMKQIFAIENPSLKKDVSVSINNQVLEFRTFGGLQIFTTLSFGIFNQCPNFHRFITKQNYMIPEILWISNY